MWFGCMTIIDLSELNPRKRMIHALCHRQHWITMCSPHGACTIKCVAESADQKAGSLWAGWLPRGGQEACSALNSPIDKSLWQKEVALSHWLMSFHMHTTLPRWLDEANNSDTNKHKQAKTGHFENANIWEAELNIICWIQRIIYEASYLSQNSRIL